MTETKQLAERVRLGIATADELRELGPDRVAEAKAQSDRTHYRGYAVKVIGRPKGYPEDAKVLRFVASTEDRDLMGDRISVRGQREGNGWLLDYYRDNGQPFLWAHESHNPPIGQGLKTWRGTTAQGGATKRALIQDVDFLGADVSKFGAFVYALMSGEGTRSGQPAMRGVSVGFVPTKYHRPKDTEERDKLGLGEYGVWFDEQILLENSATPTPANPFARLDGEKSIEAATEREIDALVELGLVERSLVREFVERYSLGPKDHRRRLRERINRQVDFPAELLAKLRGADGEDDAEPVELPEEAVAPPQGDEDALAGLEIDPSVLGEPGPEEPLADTEEPAEEPAAAESHADPSKTWTGGPGATEVLAPKDAKADSPRRPEGGGSGELCAPMVGERSLSQALRTPDRVEGTFTAGMAWMVPPDSELALRASGDTSELVLVLSRAGAESENLEPNVARLRAQVAELVRAAVASSPTLREIVSAAVVEPVEGQPAERTAVPFVDEQALRRAYEHAETLAEILGGAVDELDVAEKALDTEGSELSALTRQVAALCERVDHLTSTARGIGGVGVQTPSAPNAETEESEARQTTEPAPEEIAAFAADFLGD